MELDHLAVVADSLEAGRVWVEEALGCKTQPGGAHAAFGTHNRLLGLEDGLYLEVITIDPAAPPPGRSRWFDLDRFKGAPRPGNWICRTGDLDAVAQRFTGIGQPIELARGDLRWRMAVPADGILPYDNMFPAVIQWAGRDHPAARLAASGCRLHRLIISHPDAQALQADLAPVLEDPRLIYETGAPGLRMEFNTPTGPRVLA